MVTIVCGAIFLAAIFLVTIVLATLGFRLAGRCCGKLVCYI
jgi:hypothetical protein